MDAIALDNIPFRVDFEVLLKRLHVEEGSRYAEEVIKLTGEAEDVGKPKALYKMAFIESQGEDWVNIEDVLFTSRVLRVNLSSTHRVFAYIATCGVELDDWARALSDMLHRYWSETIREMALSSATSCLNEHLTACYGLGSTSTMSPGRLSNWPLREQRPLFSLLGNPDDAIGVQLTDSFLMIPTKTVSGLRFPTEENFESCQLCSRKGCPSRRIPYDRNLYARKYQITT